MQNLIRVLFITVLFALLFVKSVKVLLFVVLFFWIASYQEVFKLNKKVLKSIVLFNLGISLGYVIMGYIKGIDIWGYLLYINLKVYALSYFVTMFFNKTDMVQFFSFSKSLSFLLSISLSQIISYKKTFEDFKYAFKARVVKKLKQRQKKFITTVFGFFFEKAMNDAKERTLAMKARGAF
jgi:cobalt/nickel transport system permease protein